MKKNRDGTIDHTAFKDHIKKVAEEIEKEHRVLPDPVLTKLDIIIELLKDLILEIRR